MRAGEPTESGKLTPHGLQIGYEVFGDPNAPPVRLLPTWQIIHSRIWKIQIPFLARLCRVIAFDSPGNGAAERTTDPRAFEYDRIVDQAVGLLNHLHGEQANVIGFSRGCAYGLLTIFKCSLLLSGSLPLDTVFAQYRARAPVVVSVSHHVWLSDALSRGSHVVTPDRLRLWLPDRPLCLVVIPLCALLLRCGGRPCSEGVRMMYVASTTNALIYQIINT